MDNTIVSPAEYFEQVKSRKQTMTAAGLSQLYENCLALLEEYQRSGQIAAQKSCFSTSTILHEKRSCLTSALIPLSTRVMWTISSTW